MELIPADRIVPVVVYGRPGCQGCKQTVRKLDKAGVPYTYKDVDQDTAAATVADLYAARARGPKSLPLVVIGDLWWFGFRYDQLASLVDIHHATPDNAPLEQAARQYLEGADHA